MHERRVAFGQKASRSRVKDIRTPLAPDNSIEEPVRLAEAASKRRDWPEAIKHWQIVLDRLGQRAPKKFRAGLWRARQAQNSEQAQRRNVLRFKALADAEKVIWVDLQVLRYKVRPTTDIELYSHAILSGDWDLNVRAVESTVKYQSVVKHFVQGVAWADTRLFRGYSTRLARGDRVRGCQTIAQLEHEYELTVDALYDDMKERGFVLPGDKRKNAEHVPHVHIGRRGEILFGRGGNHRLAIAKILKLDRFPCLVRARHTDWQELRERIFGSAPGSILALVGPELAQHPDLADLIK